MMSSSQLRPNGRLDRYTKPAAGLRFRVTATVEEAETLARLALAGETVPDVAEPE